MITAQVAALYGEIDLRLAKWNAGIRKVEADINRLSRMPFVVTVTVNQAAFNAALARVQAQLRRFAATPIRLNVVGLAPLTAQIAALNAQLAAMSAHAAAFAAAMRGVRVPRVPPVPSPGGGWRGGHYGGIGGFGTGVLQGLGLPFALNPQMMAGAVVGGGAMAGIRESIRTESAASMLGGLTGVSPREAQRLVREVAGIARQTPGLSRGESFELADVLARAGVGAPDLPGSVRTLGRLSAMTPDADPHALAQHTVQTMNAYNMPMSEAPGFTQALAALDAEAVATASEILDITRRFAGTAKAARMPINQTMALGAQMRSVGLPVYSGSTAMGRIFGMASNPEMQAQWEGALGLAPGTMGAQFRDDPMTALETLFGGIGAATARGDVNALEFIRSELGFKNQNDVRAAGQLGGQMGEVRRMSELASQEWATGATMGDRFQRATDNAAAALEGLVESAQALGVAFGQLATGPIAWFARHTSSQLDFYASLMDSPRAAGNIVGPGGQMPAAPEMLPMRPGDRGFVGPAPPDAGQLRAMAAQQDPERFLNPFNRVMGQFSGFNMGNTLAGLGNRMLGIPGGIEHALSVMNGAAARDVEARAMRQFSPAIMDPMSAMMQQQVDILSPDLQQQSVNLLGEIAENTAAFLSAVQGLRGQGGALDAVPAVLGGLGAMF